MKDKSVARSQCFSKLGYMNDIFQDCFIEAMDVDVPESVWSRFGVDPDLLTQLQLPGVVVGDCSRWVDRWHPLPEAEPHGAIATVGNRFGIRHILQVGDEGKPIARVASFPRMAEGRQYTVEIKRVELGPDRLQLRVIGDIIIKVGAGERRHHIAFYDSAGPTNRGFYRRGARHDFLLTGITLHMRKERQAAGRECDPFMTTRALQFGGRSDAYFARVEVTRIEALHEPILGHSAWRVRGIISDDSEFPLELETLTTTLSLDGAEPPAVGEIARVDFWLIGELWHLGSQAIVLPERIPTFDETVRNADDVEPPPLWWLFGDADDDEYLEELKYHVVVACWPLTFSDGSPLIGVSLPLPEGEPAFEVRLGRGSAGCGVRTIFCAKSCRSHDGSGQSASDRDIQERSSRDCSACRCQLRPAAWSDRRGLGGRRLRRRDEGANRVLRPLLAPDTSDHQGRRCLPIRPVDYRRQCGSCRRSQNEDAYTGMDARARNERAAGLRGFC